MSWLWIMLTLSSHPNRHTFVLAGPAQKVTCPGPQEERAGEEMGWGMTFALMALMDYISGQVKMIVYVFVLHM